MKISWIRSTKDEDSFRVFKNLGLNVIEIQDLEKTDETIDKLIENRCNTIVLSNEVAGFSENIIKKYGNQEEVNIIIAPSKK